MYVHDKSPGTKLVVPIVVGTRPEAIKLVPIIVALKRSADYEPIVISTGQHNRMVEYIFELAGIELDVTLWAGSRRANLNERVASVMQRFEDFCVERFDIDPDATPSADDVLAGRHPAAVLVHGDTSSAMAASLSAFHLRIPVMHVEAGLRTGGSNLTPFPEELNRQVISTIAAMHFAPTSANLENLVRENIPVAQVFVTGNTGIDALRWASAMDVRFANPELQALHDGDSRIVVVTAHRRENWGDGLRGIAEGIARLAERPERGPLRPPGPPEPARARGPDRAPDRARQRPPDRAARLRNLRPPARPRPPGDHRLRRDPGRGALARQAGAGHPRDDRARPRASKPAPCAWSAPTPR